MVRINTFECIFKDCIKSYKNYINSFCELIYTENKNTWWSNNNTRYLFSLTFRSRASGQKYCVHTPSNWWDIVGSTQNLEEEKNKSKCLSDQLRILKREFSSGRNV